MCSYVLRMADQINIICEQLSPLYDGRKQIIYVYKKQLL